MKRTVLISGMGIAGPTLAYWLVRRGWTVTLVERAPGFRRGGYMIDFWGGGYEVGARMGILPALRARGYDVREVRLVDERGRRRGGFDVEVMRRALGGRFVNLLRSDLAEEISRAVRDDAELLFDDGLRRIDDDGAGIDVELESGMRRRFDVLVGADGVHSRTRGLAFDGEDRFLRPVGYCAAAFTAADYPVRDDEVYVGYSCPGRQIARFALRDGATVFFLIFASPHDALPAYGDVAAQKSLLRAQYAGTGWEWPAIERALEASDDLYFDSVAQIRMERWHRGRVALVGDAAFAPSLLAGEGASLAMTASYVLAGELGRAPGDVENAFVRYETLLAHMVGEKQRAAAKFGRWFAPRTRLGVAARNLASGILSLPLVGEAMARRMLEDSIDVPVYA